MNNMNFDEWLVAIFQLFGLSKDTILVDTFLKGNKTTVTFKQFADTAMRHPDWQPTIMAMVDYICTNKLFYNGRNYLPQDLANAKSYVLDYLADFVLNALLAGYQFS